MAYSGRHIKAYRGNIAVYGVNIGNDNKCYKNIIDKARRTRHDSLGRNTARNRIASLSLKELFITARDRLIETFLSLMPDVCTSTAERRNFVKEFVTRAGCSDLLVQEQSANVDANFNDLRRMVLNGSPDFSENPPRKWHDKEEAETLEQFLTKEYGRWIGKGLVRADIMRQDPHLYYALNNWRTKTKGSITHDLGIPAKKEVTEQLVRSAGGVDDPTVEAASRWKERLRSRERRTQTAPKTV